MAGVAGGWCDLVVGGWGGWLGWLVADSWDDWCLVGAGG